MTIVELLSNETAGERGRLIAAASLVGVANTLILALVNASAAKPGDAGLWVVGLLILAIPIYTFYAQYTFRRTTYLVQTALHRLRTRIIAKIEQTELDSMERVGTVEIMDRITENMAVISSSAGLLAHLLQSLCVILFATVYMALLSLPAFGLTLLIFGAGASMYLAREKEIFAHLRGAAQARVVFGEGVTDLLKGFKEVKFSRRRGRRLYEDTVQSSEHLREAANKANHIFNDQIVFGTALQFVLLGVLAFIVPMHIPATAAKLGALIAGVLFLWGPIGGLIGSYPAYVRSNHALAQLEMLEGKLDAGARAAPSREHTEELWGERAPALEAHDLEYSYVGENGNHAFHIGPINLSIEAGEVVFIVGGNGSGKSTFLKVLTGLYPPSAGRLLADGVVIQGDNVATYRETISAIYSDFHLFSKLYGLLDVDEGEVTRLLAQMKLDKKTSFKGDRFTIQDLSTGQRKRLAMVVALLEDRPLYVFDEWAADQDPEFRKYFYNELIPELKRQGKTVIAVSHDDRYFGCADRVVTMEYGAIRSIERHPGSR